MHWMRLVGLIFVVFVNSRAHRYEVPLSCRTVASAPKKYALRSLRSEPLPYHISSLQEKRCCRTSVRRIPVLEVIASLEFSFPLCNCSGQAEVLVYSNTG
jgi:hypothetical protein